jgi:glycosyltransferase involved in cell wall biosynthesis
MIYDTESDKSPRPDITVVVPVHNGSAFLGRCLTRLTASGYPFFECIVVNDGSTDGSDAVARKFPVRVLALAGGPFGPAYARNRGAELARGEILFFVDADVVLISDALHRIAKLFEEQPSLAAAFGSYDARPEAPGVVSQYRNLLHHFVHQNGNPEASTFWAGCGAIRRSVFEEIGGFDERRFSRPSIEDIELGYRLRRSGYRILLDKDLQGTHLKRWNLYSLIRTDVVYRAIPWSRLILKTRNIPDDLNLKFGQKASVVLVGLACLFLALGMVSSKFLLFSLVAIFGVGFLNRKLYAFFMRERGISFALTCVPLHLLYFLYSGISYLYVRAIFVSERRTHWSQRNNPQEPKFSSRANL